MAEVAAILTCVSASASILVSITKTIQILSEVRQQYKHADTTIRLIMIQLSTIKSALSHICDWPSFALANQNLPQNLIEGLETAMEGCELAVHSLSQTINDLVGVSTSPSPATAKTKAKLVWNESTMAEHEARLSHQVLGLQLIIQICNCNNIQEQQVILQQESSRTIINQVQEDNITLSSKGFSRKPRGALPGEASTTRLSTSGDSTYSFASPRDPKPQLSPVDLRPSSPSGKILGKLNWVKNKALGVELDDALTAKDATAVRKALEKGARVDKTIVLSERPIAYACRHDCAKILEALLQYGASPDVDCGLVAAEYGSVECMALLYDRKSWLLHDVIRIFDHALECNQSGVMVYLASSKHISLVRHIEYKAFELHKYNELLAFKALLSVEQVPNPAGFAAYEYGTAPLLQEVIVGNKPEFIEIILRYTTSPCQVPYVGDKNFLCLAASKSEETTRLLLEHGFDPNIRSKDLEAPIHHAARSGNVGVLDVLLQHKAEIDCRDSYGATALMIAASNANSGAMEFLLARKADARLVTLNGSNIVHYAAMSGQSSNVQLALKHYSTVEEGTTDLLTPRTANSKGWSPAAIALQLHHWEVIEMLLRSGVSSKPLNANTDFPLLHLAAARLDHEALQLVLSHGAQANDLMGFGVGQYCEAMCLFTTRQYDNFQSYNVQKCQEVLSRFGATPCLHEEHKFAHEGSRTMREFCEIFSKFKGVTAYMR